MIGITDNLRLILEKIVRIKPGQNLLVITDTYARSKSIANTITDLVNSMGAEAVLAMMEPRSRFAQEPPPSIAAAMKTVDAIFDINETFDIAHTNARKEATEVGAKYFLMKAEVSEDYLRKPISLEDLNKIKERTEKLAGIVTGGNIARVTTPYGTDITMSLKGRRGLPIHPFVDAAISQIPDYGEVAVAPVEGTTEGVIVVDASVQGWGYLLREPICFEVKEGRAQVETVSSANVENAERFRRTISFDQNANNCAAELGLQTSHTIPKVLLGGVQQDYGMAGNIHIAVGRNNDIGGETLSQIHQDLLLTRPTVKLDEIYVIEDGELRI